MMKFSTFSLSFSMDFASSMRKKTHNFSLYKKKNMHFHRIDKLFSHAIKKEFFFESTMMMCVVYSFLCVFICWSQMDVSEML